MTKIYMVKSCPFCGARTDALRIQVKPHIKVICEGCRAHGPAAPTADLAIDAWGARPDPLQTWVNPVGIGTDERSPSRAVLEAAL